MNFDSLLSDIIATVVGGIILTLLFFFIREKLFPMPKISGKWYLEIKVNETAYKPYKNMLLRFVIMIWVEGSRIKGTSEKIYEELSNGKEYDFIGKERIRSHIDGYIEKKYFGKDKIYLHIVENGKARESTSFYDLVMESNSKMSGTFDSMIANMKGEVICTRKISF